jgi:hypothetical protein
MKTFRSLTPALALASWLNASAAAEIVTFDDAKIGGPPQGWFSTITGVGDAKWTIESDVTAPSTPQVLQQSGQVPKPSFPLCLLDAPALRDGFVEVKFKPVSGTNDQAAGVVWRAQDATNYYVCRANALEDNVVLYKVVAGKRTALDIGGRASGYGVEAKVPPGRWQTLRVEFAGQHFRVWLEARLLFEVEDSTFTEAGKVGLWTKADSVTRFDNFRCGEK